MSKKKEWDLPTKIIKFIKTSYLPIVLSLFALLLLISAYHFYYGKRIIPGVAVGSAKLSGMTYDQAIASLQRAETFSDKTLVLNYEDKEFTIHPNEVSLDYNWEGTVIKAFEIGRTGNFFTDSRDKIVGLMAPLRVKALYSMNPDAFNQKLAAIKGEINRPYINAEFALNTEEIKILPEEEGLKVVDQHLYDLIIFSYDNLDFREKTIRTEPTYPKVVTADLENIREEAKEIIFKPLTVTYGARTWDLTPEQILEMLTVDKDSNRAEVALNKNRFDAFAESLGREVNEPPRGRVTEMDGINVVGFEIIQGGRELDVQKFSEDFEDALFGEVLSVEISLIETSGEDNPAKYGIFTLLGEGRSNFRGSAAGRVKNLTLAAQRTSGVLVPPGAVFSFNRSVGPISAATGYDQAYIILGGRTVLGEGGGVCQTSTTLFRAILNSGLPIVERHPHAYRVSYYELDSKVGFDAAIFQPYLDLQFKNDTENYILVQAFWNLEQTTLTYRLYGTPDGREVSISEPVVTNVIPAPEPLYQDDDTLPEGTVKQIDFAAAGASVSFTREVTRDGEVLYQDTISSRFQPWRAVFLVGTQKED
jgi:vancomycin resistance protein YoaR